jgi:hypothetical protein
MLSALHAGDAPVSALPGSNTRLRVHPRNIRPRDDNTALVETLAGAVASAFSASGGRPCTLVIDASELGMEHLHGGFFRDMHAVAANRNLERRIAAVVIENPSPLSKALYSAAKHLGSGLCAKVQLK